MPKPRVVRHEVTQPLNESYRLIPLTQNQNAIVDVEDFEWLSQWYWMAMLSPEADTFYVIRRSNGKTFRMHREIIKCSSRKEVDHKNGNGLDNRKQNLRPCTHAQNICNTKSSKRKYKGVNWNKQSERWRSMIMRNGHSFFLGCFDSPEEAAHAYDEAAKKYHGEFAVLNFPVKSKS